MQEEFGISSDELIRPCREVAGISGADEADGPRLRDKADYDRITPLKDATFSILGLNNGIAPRQQVTLRVQPADAEAFDVPVIVRIDTPIEKEYYLAGGILQYVLTQILR